MDKKVVFSGAQPSGAVEEFHIGNYFGAIKQWAELQQPDTTNYYCVVDLHALTVYQDPEKLRKRRLEFIALYIAAGIDYKKSIVFLQSDVPAHSELNWILAATSSKFGDLMRMTQFKDKKSKYGEETIGTGLFNYPILMTADILLYNTNIVPVGVDQTQHVEFAREVANTFNNKFGDLFVVPEVQIGKQGSKILRLDDPTKKMSKSDESGYSKIGILENADEIRKKIGRAATDSDNKVKYDKQKKLGVSNLIEIYSLSTGKEYKEIEKEFEGKGYKEFKDAVAEALIGHLQPMKDKYTMLMNDKAELESIAENGAKKASIVANDTLLKVQKAVGIR